MAKFITLLIVLSVSTLSRSLVIGRESIDSEIEQLASATGQNITGLRKSEALLDCLKAGNCTAHRYRDSEWRASQAIITPQAATEPKNRIRQNQCAAFHTNVTIGSTMINYGMVDPADVFQSISSICFDTSCDTGTPKYTPTSIVADAGMDNVVITTTADADYPDPTTRDAMIAVAVQAASENVNPQMGTYHECVVAGPFNGCKAFQVSQNYSVNFIAVDVYNAADSSLRARLHISVSVPSQPGNKVLCEALVFNVYNIIKNLTNSWAYLLGSLSLACG
jgi:hypothetical protein